jgi:hypothetical protein
MSKWPMQGHFRYLSFQTFPMTPRTPQCKVFWALLSRSKHPGVPEDSKSPTLQVLGFTLTLGQSGVATISDSSKQLQVCENFQRNTKSLQEFASYCSSAHSWKRRRRQHFFYEQNREKSNYITTGVELLLRTPRASIRINFSSGQHI